MDMDRTDWDIDFEDDIDEPELDDEFEAAAMEAEFLQAQR